MKKAIAILLCAALVFSLPITSLAKSPLKTEAENYKECGNSVTVETDARFGSFSGSGYIKVGNSNAVYTVNVQNAGYYDLSFACAFDGDGTRLVNIDIGGKRYRLCCDAVQKNKWTVCTLLNEDLSALPYGVYLDSGANTVTVYGEKQNAGAVMPEISKNSSFYGYEIEDGETSPTGTEITTSIPDYSGSGAVKLYDGYVSMNIYVPETRYYNVKIHSASYDGNNKCDDVLINDVKYTVKTSAQNSQWICSDISDANGNKLNHGIELKKGVNNIMIRANWGYCAYDKLSLESIPYLSSMYVVPDLAAPSSTSGTVWGQNEWNECFARLGEVGIDTVIMQYTAQYWSDTSQFFYYNRSQNNYIQPNYQRNQVEYALKAAKQYGMQVYLGLQVAEDMWFADMSNGFNSSFLGNSANFSKTVAQELWTQFSSQYAEQIAGWYLPFELNNKQVSGDSLTRFINNYLKPVTTYLKSLSSDKLIMMSPLVYHDDYTLPANPQYLNIWKAMCNAMWQETPLDIIAPQDGCGWESTCKENLGEWFEALYNVANDSKLKQTRENNGWGEAQIWDNAESYNMNGIDQMPVNRLVADMNAVAPFVSKFSSFSMHYFVPFASGNVCGTRDNNYMYYNAYKNYYNNKQLITDNSALPTPCNISIVKSNSFDSCVSFDTVISTDANNPVAGYVIKRKVAGKPDDTAIKVAEIGQEPSTRINYTDYQLESGVTYKYYIYSFDAYGNRCAVPATAEYTVESTGFESNRSYTDNIALSKQTSVKSISGIVADNYNPDGFTDGNIGKRIDDWNTDRNVWCGFQSGYYNGVYELTVNGLENEGVGYVYLSALYQPNLGVNLPACVEAYIGESATPVATVYPKSSFKTDNSGNVWIGINLGKAYSADSIRLKVTQYDEWTMISEIRVIGAVKTEFTNSDPQNLVSGKPVTVSGYASWSTFFGFNNNQTYSATVNGFAPGISYYEDSTQTQMAGVGSVDNTYRLTVSFDSPQRINMIGSRWIQDENLGIYIPDRIDYFGVTQSGQSVKLSTVTRAGKPQLDWTSAPSDNLRSEKISDLKCLVNDGNNYVSVYAVIYPKYTNGWTFFNNFYVY